MVPVLDLTVGRLNPVNAGLTTYPLNEQFVRRDDLVLEREHAAFAPVPATASRWAMSPIARTASRAR